jgi:lysophospholipase L1-like esterase
VQLQFDMLPFQPDLVLVMHNVNDLTVNYYAARFGKPVDPSYHVKFGIKSYTGVVDDGDVVLSRLWHSARVRLEMLLHGVPSGAISDSFSIDDGLAAFRRNMRSIAAVGLAHGTDVVFLTMPVSRSREIYDSTRAQARGSDPGYFPSHARFLRDFDAYNDAVKAAGRDASVPVIDMESAMRGRDPEFFLDVVHYSDEGSRTFGQTLAMQLAPLLPAAGASPPFR